MKTEYSSFWSHKSPTDFCTSVYRGAPSTIAVGVVRFCMCGSNTRLEQQDKMHPCAKAGDNVKSVPDGNILPSLLRRILLISNNEPPTVLTNILLLLQVVTDLICTYD